MNGLPNIPSRREVAEAFKADGGFIAGVLPIHYPRALLRSFNFLPMEIWGPPSVESTFGEAHLQPYVCSIVRNALSFIQTSTFELVDLLLVPHACDSLQGFGSILLDFLPPMQPVLPLYLPRVKGKSALEYLVAELKVLYRALEDFTSYSPKEDKLRESILREEQADQILGILYKNRSILKLTTYDFYRLVRSREFLPAERFCEFARQELDRGEHEPREGIPILLSGIVPEPMGLLRVIADRGGQVVADDFACCGRRLYDPGESEDPITRMAESILHAPPDWSLGRPIQDRLEYLLQKCGVDSARGVIFYNIKFCEPELFDIPTLREGLRKAGILSTVIEVDIAEPLSNQVITRVEAFLEMIA